MKKKIYTCSKVLSCLLLLILGAVCAFCSVRTARAAGVHELEKVTLDFKEFAIEASEQDWWDVLQPAADDQTVYIGSKKAEVAMNASARAAYSQMIQYMEDNCNWRIDENISSFLNSYYLKQLYFNCSEDVSWGISYYAWYSGMPERNKLAITFDVPSEGWYALNITAFHEGTSGAINVPGTTGGYAGSGYGDFYVNGTKVYDAYKFSGDNETFARNFGAVYLNEGENSIEIVLSKDYTGAHGSGRRNINLRSIEFTKLGSLYISTAADEVVDLTQSYLAFDKELIYGTHTVSSSDTSTVKAEITEKGDLLVSGMQEGDAQITLYESGVALYAIPVSVTDAVSGIEELTRLSYTVDGSETPTILYQNEGTASVTAISNFKNEYAMDVLKQWGDLYFVADNSKIVSVDHNGNLIAQSEGSTRVRLYFQMGEKLFEDYVYVTVADHTALEEIEITASVDYVGVGNYLQLFVRGTNESGCAADMNKYKVSYYVDDTDKAAISENGLLLALGEGTVNVTAEVMVKDLVLTAQIPIRVVNNSELAGKNVVLDFTDGLALRFKTATLEADGKQLNRELTVAGGNTLSYGTKHGIILSSAAIGDRLAIDFIVPKDGWYCIESWGSLVSYGAVTDVYLDDLYIGVMDFNQGKNSTYGGNSIMNTVYLKGGVHTCVFECTERGTYLLGKIICRAADDPTDMDISFAAQQQMLVGQTTNVELKLDTGGYRDKFTLKVMESDETPGYTNYCRITSSNSGVIAVNGAALTAVSQGSATITVTGEINGAAFSRSTTVEARAGKIAEIELLAERATLAPTDGGTDLIVKAYGTNGELISLPSGVSVSYISEDMTIASVSSSGAVRITGKEGSSRIVCTVTENGRQIESALWITVTAGKTEPTIFTYEERRNALENVGKYSWAANLKNTAVKKADKVLANLDTYYDNFIFEAFPRCTRVGTRTDPNPYYCRYCKAELAEKYGVYPWIVDPINNPWKITCPVCRRDFPSNDFESYYKSGLGEDGRFYAEKADTKYLVNELYPEMGEGWGVDNGFGYDTGRTFGNGAKEIHTYIGYYMHCVFDSLSSSAVNDMVGALNSLREAYLYTGDEKYGSAGAILIDRMADIYPEYDYFKYDRFDRGKIVNAIWEAVTIGQCLAQAADAFWPAMDNDDVIAYLRDRAAWKGVKPEEITPEYVRNNIDNGILLEIRDACYTANNAGNFGMHQASMAYAAVALDRLPETKEMIDWIFRYGENKTDTSVYNGLYVTGGGVLNRLINDVTRDGLGSEGSNMYNPMWYQNLMEVADALDGYTRVEGVDLWQNPKFVDMFNPFNKLILCGTAMLSTGESGSVQSYGIHADLDCMQEAFIRTGNRDLARGLYLANKNSVKNLHGNIFTKDPEAGIQADILRIVQEDGEWVWNKSEMLCGYGAAFLRNGPAVFEKGVNNDKFSDYWMFFGICGGAHGEHEALNIGIEAYGLIASPTLGYATVVTTTDPERMQWLQNTVSHNTVVVNDKCQSGIDKNSFPMHFDDAGKVKVVDAEAPGAYEEADIYRRTLVTVQAEDDAYYAVDFFRVLGGKEHVYSFHAATTIAPETTGLDFVHQPIGTYAGPEVPFGDHVINPDSTDAALNTGSGYSWLQNVYRDTAPATTFSVDFELEDFRNVVMNSEGVRMRFTMVSEEPMTEVAVADGKTPVKSGNPDFLKYLLIRRSGNSDMDTLFTSVIQPYRDNTYIQDVKLLRMDALSGEKKVTDRAAAVKVTLKNGRVDYIMYASNENVLYSVKEEEKEILQFAGFAGVCSFEKEKVVCAYANETTLMKQADGTVLIENTLPRITGTVADFTKELSSTYTMTVSLDQAATKENLIGNYIYVENDGMENGVYQIFDAEISGNTAVLDLHTQTLIRSYIDGSDISKGYVYNIKEGQRFEIPLGCELQCLHTRKRVTYEPNGDGTHTTVRTCAACWKIVGTTVVACKDGTDTDLLCDYCGDHVQDVIAKFDIVGANMTLGNELKVNFMIKKSDMKDGYIAKVSQAGAPPVEVELWSYNAAYYAASYSVAAKEMTDVLAVEIYDSNGNLVSNPFTRTVKQYAMTLMGQTTTKATLKSVIVDMLNYGTEAQKYFKYHEDDYANADLTAVQQNQFATKDVVCTNCQNPGQNFVGANLSLEDSILLNVFFKGISDGDVSGMTAKISFKDYKGNEVIAEAPVVKYNSSMAKVVVNQIVLADSRRPITVSVYKNGVLFGSGIESVESYIARNINNTSTANINLAIMKFAMSAYNYLGGTN